MAETRHFDVSKLFSVQGWVCVVTGGGTGIGLMATQALAANGAKVYITGRRTEALENAATEHNPSFSTGGKIIPVGPCDVRKKNGLEKIVEDLQTKYGEKYINLLVCNAGVSGTKGATVHLSKLMSAEFQQTGIRVNSIAPG